MGKPLVTSGLTSATAARIKSCGHLIKYARPDGTHVAGRWPCGSSWCVYCALRRRDRVTPIVAKRIGVKTVHLVTLTLPHREDLSEDYCRKQCELVREIWREIMTRVRWAKYHLAKGKKTAAEVWSLLPAPGTPDPHPKYASEYDAETKWGLDPTILDRGVWSREVTSGKDTPGWHVHIHAVVQDLRSAQILNAGWQQVCREFGVRPNGGRDFVQTDIEEVPAGKGAYYVAKYLSKLDALDLREKHGDRAHEVEKAYVRGTKGMRRSDAWGEWRPLGLALKGSGKFTHITPKGFGEAVELGEYFGESSLARLIRYGELPSSRAGLDELGLAGMPHEVRCALEAHQHSDPETKKALQSVGLAIARTRGLTVTLKN